MKLSIAFDADLSPCGAHHKQLARITTIEASVHGLLAGQFYFDTAYCCPLCGQVWAREWYITSAPSRWVFEARECGGPFVSTAWLDYMLLSNSLSRPEQEFLIHEYARCSEYYRGDRPGQVARGGSLPSIEEL